MNEQEIEEVVEDDLAFVRGDAEDAVGELAIDVDGLLPSNWIYSSTLYE